MKIVYYNEYKRDAAKAERIIKNFKRIQEFLPYDYYIDAEVRLHFCPAQKIKEDTGYTGCLGLTYPRQDGSYDVYVSVKKEAILTTLHEMMHVVIFESGKTGLFITPAYGQELMKEYNPDYDRSQAKDNWMEYICCSYERYKTNEAWRAAHPKTGKFFEMRGF